MKSAPKTMNNYVHRLGLTAWRKKTSIIVTTGLLTLILFGLQYSRIEDENLNDLKEERDAKVVAEALMRSVNVKFIEAANKITGDQNIAARNNIAPDTKYQKFRNEPVKRDATASLDTVETDQQLGIPYVNLDPNNIYIPERRIVHLDLKGAPPLLSYLKKLFPLIKNMGATGILLEYEDMFPYTGSLRNISAKNAYKLSEIREILAMADNLKLDVIPLIQTFGHLEFALKISEFAHIREVNGSPQALCPSRSSSINFLKEMIDQVMAVHHSTSYIHIGCDEVFQMGECDVCRLEIHENLFLKHVKHIAGIIRLKYPTVRVIIWDDMLRHVSQQSLQDTNIGSLVEPMVWVYAEDVYRFVQPGTWEKYAAVFETAWAASAFKGAFGETLYVPNAKRHLENNLKWLDVMSTQSAAFKRGFAGIVLTGWQRYDHFAVLCELMPAALPSLTLSLTAITYGYFNASLKNKFLTSLSCPKERDSSPFINLDIDPLLWEKLNRVHEPLAQYRDRSKGVSRRYHQAKGWMTPYNVRHNYSLPLRVEELTVELPRMYHGMMSLAKTAVDAMVGIFDNYTISEWVEQKIYPYVFEFERLQNQSLALKSVNHWPVRPLPPLKDMQRLGIGVTVN